MDEVRLFHVEVLQFSRAGFEKCRTSMLVTTAVLALLRPSIEASVRVEPHSGLAH